MLTKILAVAVAVFFIGCGSEKEAVKVEPKLVVGKSLSDLKLNDQFEKSHGLNSDTYKVIFAFAKESAHTCNDFFNTKEPKYLAEHNAQFVADVSSAPSIIRSLFILPGLKDFKHTVLLLDDKAVAAPFREGMEVEKIVIVYVVNKEITEIDTITSTEELQKTIEETSAMSIMAPIINQVLDY